MIKKILLPLIVFIVVGCQSTPGTGRSQLILVNQSEIASMAAGEFSKMKKVSNDPRLERIRTIGLKIVEVARREDKYRVLPPASQWQFAIIDDESPNAFAMPGGKIGFNKGMFAYAPNDEDIAVILGHEVSHVLARHSSERISQNLLTQVGAITIDEATRNESAAVRRAWMSGFGLGAKVGVLLPFSRAHEEEADYLGLIFMARAGYNPEAAPAFWQRFSNAGGKKPPEFFSTHPADETRVRKLKAWLPEAKAQMPKPASL